MRLGVYGGTFNPPHLGHVRAAESAARQLKLDVLIVVPSGIPPHKVLPVSSPRPEDRLEMARLSFASLQNAIVSNVELMRTGVNYTVDTVTKVLEQYPGAETFLIMGSDMFLTLEEWKSAERLLKLVRPAVLVRGSDEDAHVAAYADKLRRTMGPDPVIVRNDALPVSSSALRAALPLRGGADLIEEKTYAYIIKNRIYGAKPDFDWLRARAFEMLKPKRIPHVLGCEAEAVKLAQHYGANVDDAREAAILHDITKAMELDDQLQLCRKYDIMTDAVEQAEAKLLHSKTGAALARDLFGASEGVHDAIYWHTTGCKNMTLLDKIIYIADYIEPTRDFDGVDALRSLSYNDLDLAIIKGLQMSIDDMRSRGIVPHLRTEEALNWLLGHMPQ